MSKEYTSALAPALEAFVDFKATASGNACESLLQFTRSFDRWCRDRGHLTLDEGAVLGYARARLESCNPAKRQYWASALRELSRWARVFGGMPDAFVLPAGIGGGRGGRPTPYLLTDREVEAFFGAASSYDDGTPMTWQATCFFGLMCCCGLRNCEVMRLAREDFDAGSPHIDVLRSKGHRSRRLAITDDVAQMVSDCDAVTTDRFGADRRALLVTGRGSPLNHNAVYRAFGRIWEAAGLPEEKGGARPSPYAFRHRFAYANIERWWREGRDVMAMLPYLQRYMGHSSLESTLWYVHTSPDFLSSFAGAVSSLDGLLPEVTFRGQA